MARNVLTIKDLGSEICWMLVQQAIGIPDAKLQSDFMTERVALLVFARHSLPERLCVTAAVRQMGGTTIFEGCESDVWQKEASGFQEHLMPIFGYYLDCLYAYGLPVTSWNISETEVRFPVINAGSPDAHPVHALADIACMLRISRYLKGVTAAWVGCVNAPFPHRGDGLVSLCPARCRAPPVRHRRVGSPCGAHRQPGELCLFP